MKPEFYTLPKAMYALDAIKLILADDNNAILYKKLDTSLLDMEKIIVSHSIVYVKSGRVEIQTYDYEKFSISDGEMLFMPRDSYLISDYIKEKENMEVYLFFFDYALCKEFLTSAPFVKEKTTSQLLKLNVSRNILSYISSLEHMHYENKHNKHLLKMKIFELLHLLCESNKHLIDVLNAQEKVKEDIQAYMLEHFDKNLSVSDWASLSGQSLSTFNRRFKQKYNQSPKKWIIRQNMKLANEALEKGMSVSECAREFGYSNASNFIKAFKEVYKITPKQLCMT